MTENKPTATESGMPISNTCRDITGIGVCKCWRIPDDDGPTEIERYAQQQRERAERAEAECVANHQMYAELSASLAQMTMDRDRYIDCYAGQMKEANAAIAEVARLREGLEALRRTEHRECEDPWYSCPFSKEGCADDSIEYCTCGLEEWNNKIDAILNTPPAVSEQGREVKR